MGHMHACRVVVSVTQTHPLDIVQLPPLPLQPLDEALTEEQHRAAQNEEEKKVRHNPVCHDAGWLSLSLVKLPDVKLARMLKAAADCVGCTSSNLGVLGQPGSILCQSAMLRAAIDTV